MMQYDEIRKDIFNCLNETGSYPKAIKLNSDLLVDLKQAGYISLSAADPSKITFLGIKVEELHDVDDYELVN
ncbi:MAG: hypothetical protein ACI4XS_06445 [Bacillus sp. (in: firmicutes)]